MIGRTNHHQFILAACQRGQIGLCDGASIQADIERMITHFRRHGFRFGNGQPRLHLRKTLLEFPQDARQQVFGNGGGGTIIKGPVTCPVSSPTRASNLGGQVQNPLSVAQHQITYGRHRNFAVATLEQAGIEMLFQLLDLKGHCRLGHIKDIRGFGES